MNVSLTPELTKFVEEKVQSGRYADASEVVREGLCLLKRSDEIRSTHRAQIEKNCSDAASHRPAAVPKPRTAARKVARPKAKPR